MKIKTVVWACALALVAIIGVGIVFFQQWQPDAGEESGDGSSSKGRAQVTRRAVNPRPAKRAADDDGQASEDSDAAKPEMDDEPDTEPEPEMTEEEKKAEEEEKRVDEFDATVDKWMEPSDDKTVTMADIDAFRDKFRKVPKARKEECVQRALNLIPDDNVMLLAGILFDKEQDKEILELVFNDILNRDEEVKKPILNEIFKDKEHPNWADTAWILDVTGELPGNGQNK